MIQLLFDKARARRGSSASWLGQMGYNVLDQNGVDVTARLTGERPDRDGFVFGKNRVVDQGINYLLNAALRGEGVLSTFYIAPFAANVAPAAGLTAANFAATMTEFTNYTQPARPAWVSDAASTAKMLENASAPALFTIAGGAGAVIWGGAVVSASPKSSTAGIVVAAQKRATALNVEADYEIRVKYRISGSSS